MTTADSTQEPKLVKSSAVVGAATMLSRVLGLLRDVVLANLIGANGNADAVADAGANIRTADAEADTKPDRDANCAPDTGTNTSSMRHRFTRM